VCIFSHENPCTHSVEPAPASLDVTASGQADYVAEACVWPRRVSVENLSVSTSGGNFLLVDGAARFFPYDIDHNAFAALGTRDSGDRGQL
jgi:hypothetical protein